MAAANPPPIVVEPSLRVGAQTEVSGDSAYDSDIASYTTSLASGVTDFKFENGRRYHAYKEGSYMLPNDETENDRLDLAHKMADVAMKGKLFFAPLKEENVKRVMDLGTGTGIWAIEFADLFPKAQILGNDLSPTQPRWVPPNVQFEVDDIEADWTFSQKFDFIHCRYMAFTVKDWPRLMSQAFENTVPGGYVEFQDYDLQWTSPDGTYENSQEMGPCIMANDAFLRISREVGKDPCPGPSLEKWVKDAGFEDVVATRLPLPVGTWPADKHLKELGAWNYLQLTEGIEGFLMWIFTRFMGYSADEVKVLCAQYKKHIKDPRMHGLYYLYIVHARKPVNPTSAATTTT